MLASGGEFGLIGLKIGVAAAAGLVLALGPTAAGASGISNVASDAGIAQLTRTYAVATADYNDDGRRDLLLVRHGPEECCPDPELYRNQGGSFSLHQQTWPVKDRHGCDFGDANNDGRLDFFCAVGLQSSSTNELEIQRTDGTFENRAPIKELADPATTHGRYRDATFLDVNDDGLQDIFVARYTGPNYARDCAPDCYPGDDFPNELWIQQPDRHFQLDTSYGVSTSIGAFKDAHACTLPTDFNQDGLDDLTYCSPHGIRVWRNDGGYFTDITRSIGVGGEFVDAQWRDLNGDGLLDLLEVKHGKVRVMTQDSVAGFTQPFTETYTYPMVASHSVSVGDFDGDGLKDFWVVGTCTNARPSVDEPDNIFFGTTLGTYEPMSQQGTLKGCGDDVASLDYDRDGNSEFVVVNGRRKIAGPVQLFDWQS